MKKLLCFVVIVLLIATNIKAQDKPESTPAKETLKLDIFPNPTHGKLTFWVYQLPDSVEQAIIMIYDFMGKEVYRTEKKMEGNLIDETIDLNEITDSGIYCLVAKAGNETIKKNFIFKKE